MDKVSAQQRIDGAFFRKCVTAVWVKDKVQHDHRIQS